MTKIKLTNNTILSKDSVESYLVSIDTSNLLADRTMVRESSVSYSASQDCFMVVSWHTDQTSTYVNIDNKTVSNLMATSTKGSPTIFPLEKGQVFYIYNPVVSRYRVFGIK